MPTFTVGEARSKLYRLIDETAASHQPILITGKRSNAVLVSEDDWRALQETVHILSVPHMRDSIRPPRSVQRTSTREMATCLHKTGPERCEKTVC